MPWKKDSLIERSQTDSIVCIIRYFEINTWVPKSQAVCYERKIDTPNKVTYVEKEKNQKVVMYILPVYVYLKRYYTIYNCYT